MPFEDIFLEMDSCTESFESLLDQIHVYMEAQYNHYVADKESLDLQLIQESSEEEIDEIVALEATNKAGFAKKTKDVIQKMIKSFIDWINSLIEKISKLFSKGANGLKAKLDAVLKKDPKLKKEKIKVGDPKKINQVCDKHISMVNKKLSALKAGKTNGHDSEDIDKIQKSFEKEMSTAKKAGIGVAVTAAFSFIVGMGIHLHKAKKNVGDISGKISSDLEKQTPEAIAAAVEGSGLIAAIEKERTKSISNYIKNAFTKLRHLIKGQHAITIDYAEEVRNDPKRYAQAVNDAEKFVGRVKKENKKASKNMGKTTGQDAEEEQKSDGLTSGSSSKGSSHSDGNINKFPKNINLHESVELDKEAYLESILEELDRPSMAQFEREIDSLDDIEDIDEYAEALESVIESYYGDDDSDYYEESSLLDDIDIDSMDDITLEAYSELLDEEDEYDDLYSESYYEDGEDIDDLLSSL